MSDSLHQPDRLKLLLDRKPSDDAINSSVVEFLGPLIIELGMRADLRFAPDVAGWTENDYNAWAQTVMDDCDAAIIVDPRLHGALRLAGWKGPCILNPMGGLAHGAGLTRAYARQVTTRDRIWYVGNADVALHGALFDSENDVPAVLNLPYPCDTDAFKPQRRTTDSNSVVRLVYAGHMMADKNVHSLLYVLRDLLNRGLDCELIFAGSFEDRDIPSRSHYASDYEEYFWALVAYLDLEKNVVFVGRLPTADIVQLYASADVYVNPTFAVGDNFGLSRVQAQMVGLPVVTAAWAGTTSYRSEIQFNVPTYMTCSGPRFSIVSFADAVADVVQVAPTMDYESLIGYSRLFEAGAVADTLLDVLDELLQSPLQKMETFGTALLKRVEEVAPVRVDGQIPSLRGLSYQDSILRDLHSFYTTYDLVADSLSGKYPSDDFRLELVPGLAPVDGNVVSLDPLYRIAGKSRTVMEMIDTCSQGQLVASSEVPHDFRQGMALGYLVPVLPAEGCHEL